MTAVTAYIAIGANVEPEDNILDGLERLHRIAVVTKVSRFYRTEPLNRVNQPSFLNGVCEIRTALPPRVLKFRALRRIEWACGRRRTLDTHAPRPLDLDILLYGNRIIRQEGLCIPDPDISARPFIFHPLMEIAGNIRLPGTGVELINICSKASYDSLDEDTSFRERLFQRFPKWDSGNKSPQT